MAIAPRSAEEILREVSVLKELSSAELKQLADACEERKTASATPVFSEGQKAEGLFLVRTGECKIIKRGKDEREQILYLARPGKPIVEGVRFDGAPYAASAVAMRITSVFLISNDVLWEIGERKPQVLRALVDLRARRADRTLALVSDLSLRTVPARLASFLCTLVAVREARGEDARHLIRDLTTETVAGMLGTVREEISRGLAYLEREGGVKVSPDSVEIRDLERLQSIAYGESRR